MFEQVAVGNDVQFLDNNKVDAMQARQKIERLDAICVHGFEYSSDDELKRMRREERYATVSRH